MIDDTYYGVPTSQLRSLLSSEQTLMQNEHQKFTEAIKTDGHYLSRDKLEKMIQEAERVKSKYTPEGMDVVLHLMYEIRHDCPNYINKNEGY